MVRANPCRPPASNGSVAGCGEVLFMLSGQIGEGIGIDICQADLDRAESERQGRKLTNVMFQRADATVLPFASNSFDVVLLFELRDDVVADRERVMRHDRQAGRFFLAGAQSQRQDQHT